MFCGKGVVDSSICQAEHASTSLCPSVIILPSGRSGRALGHLMDSCHEADRTKKMVCLYPAVSTAFQVIDSEEIAKQQQKE